MELGVERLVIARDEHDRLPERAFRPLDAGGAVVDVAGQHDHIGLGRGRIERRVFEVQVRQDANPHVSGAARTRPRPR